MAAVSSSFPVEVAALLDIESLQKKREAWLQLHDRQTAGVMGLLPLVQDLPMRMTETIHVHDRRLYKHMRCRLKGWEVKETELEQIQNTQEPEVVLQRQPQSLLLEFEGPGETKEVHRLQPKYVTWTRDKAGNAKVRRKGFTIVPDFAGTAHGYCGDTLEQSKGDLLEWYRTPTMDAMLRGYIIRSRVREVDRSLLIQPYSPKLFSQGVLPGPTLLLEAQRGAVKGKALERAWKKAQQEEEERKGWKENWPWSMELPCRGCTMENKGEVVLRPLSAFSMSKTYRDGWKAICKGQDMLCFKCSRHWFTKVRKETTEILCETCCMVLAASRFSTEMRKAWRQLEGGPFTCKSCAGEHTNREDLEFLFCHGKCAQEWPENAFDVNRVAELRRGGQEALLECLRCTAMSEKNTRLEKTHTCFRCKRTLPLAAYSPIVLRVLLLDET